MAEENEEKKGVTDYVVNAVVDQDGGLARGQLPAAGILSEAAVVGHQVCQVVQIALETAFRQVQPVHHVSAVVHLEEGL